MPLVIRQPEKNGRHTAASGQYARTRVARMTRIMLGILLLCAAFVIGFVLRGQVALLDSLGFAQYATEATRNPGATVSGDTYDSIGARVEEVEGIIAGYSLNSFDLDNATQGVIGALVDSVDDPYFDYYDEKRYALFLQETSNITAGIGVLFSEDSGIAYAADVFEGSPAQAAGVQQGDSVVSIDGDRGHDWTSTEVTSHLLEAEGESVVITWKRANAAEGDEDAMYTTTLECGNYSIKNVEHEKIGSTGVITVHQISQDTTELVRDAVAVLEADGATSFVLDLRNNPGGYLTQAADTANLFVRSGTLVKVLAKESDESVRSASGEVVTDAPLAVLVNENTGAAAEVLAAALQDNQRAVVVGSKTHGKGSVQVTCDLSFGGAIRYTAAYYVSPLGHDIDGVGISPDVAVAQSDSADSQLQIAIETAQAAQAA